MCRFSMVLSDLLAWLMKYAARSSRMPGCSDCMRKMSSTATSHRAQDTDALQNTGNASVNKV
jgi:hypothetical protein